MSGPWLESLSNWINPPDNNRMIFSLCSITLIKVPLRHLSAPVEHSEGPNANFHHTVKESVKYWSKNLKRYIAFILCYRAAQILRNGPLTVLETRWDLCMSAWPQWYVLSNSVYETLQADRLPFLFLSPGWLISVQVVSFELWPGEETVMVAPSQSFIMAVVCEEDWSRYIITPPPAAVMERWKGGVDKDKSSVLRTDGWTGVGTVRLGLNRWGSLSFRVQ